LLLDKATAGQVLYRGQDIPSWIVLPQKHYVKIQIIFRIPILH
jgi:hypothetical protein